MQQLEVVEQKISPKSLSLEQKILCLRLKKEQKKIIISGGKDLENILDRIVNDGWLTKRQLFDALCLTAETHRSLLELRKEQ